MQCHANSRLPRVFASIPLTRQSQFSREKYLVKFSILGFRVEYQLGNSSSDFFNAKNSLGTHIGFHILSNQSDSNQGKYSRIQCNDGKPVIGKFNSICSHKEIKSCFTDVIGVNSIHLPTTVIQLKTCEKSGDIKNEFLGSLLQKRKECACDILNTNEIDVKSMLKVFDWTVMLAQFRVSGRNTS